MAKVSNGVGGVTFSTFINPTFINEMNNVAILMGKYLVYLHNIN